MLNTDSVEELNTYLDTNYGKTIVDPEPKAKPTEQPKKRYPIYMWDAIETAVAKISEIPEEHKEEFVSLVGDRATKKKVPRAGWKAAKLPKALISKYPELDFYGRDNYNSFLPFGDSDTNDIGLTLEEALLEIYNVMRKKWFPESLNSATDITSAQKTGVEWIKTKVWNAIVAKLEDDGWEPDDISDYVFVDVTQEDDRIRVEVRAELSYEGLEELIESIDPIVQEYDNNAYFEPVEPGIAEAYIYNLSNITSSETVEAGIYDVPDRPLDPPEDNSWEELDSDDEVIELTLDAIVHIDENGSWEYDDTNYPWAASPDNKKGDWYTDEYSVYIGDKTSIVEYVDELLEPMMPAKEGEYHIKGDVTLVFSVEGIEVKRDYFWDERHGADYDEEAYTDDAETSFLYDKSHIKNFEITER